MAEYFLRQLEDRSHQFSATVADTGDQRAGSDRRSGRVHDLAVIQDLVTLARQSLAITP